MGGGNEATSISDVQILWLFAVSIRVKCYVYMLNKKHAVNENVFRFHNMHFVICNKCFEGLVNLMFATVMYMISNFLICRGNSQY